jgi:hypothetical protein
MSKLIPIPKRYIALRFRLEMTRNESSYPADHGSDHYRHDWRPNRHNLGDRAGTFLEAIGIEGVIKRILKLILNWFEEKAFSRLETSGEHGCVPWSERAARKHGLI